MQFDFEPSSRHRFVVLYDAAALPADFPVDPDLATPEPDPPSHTAVRELAKQGRAFVVEVPSEEDCQATIRVFVDENPPAELVKRGKCVARESLMKIPSGVLRAAGSEFMCLPGQQRTEVENEPEAKISSGDYLLTVHELVRWKLKHRRSEIRARTTPVARFVDVLTQGFGFFCAVLFVAHILVVPVVLWIAWRKHGGHTALKIGGIILAVDAVVYLLILLLAALEKKFDLFNVAEVRRKFDAEHPDFVVVLQSANGRSGSGETALFKWPRS